MKFTNTLMTLIAATSALSFQFDHTLFIKNLNVTLGNDSLSNSECKKNINKIYEPCMNTNINKSNVENECSIYKSEQCQNMFKYGITSLKGCENYPDVVKSLYTTLFEVHSNQLNIFCEKDLSGNLCPVGEFLLNNPKNKEPPMSEILATCQSKSCTEKTLKLYTSYLESLDIIKDSLISINQPTKKINETESKNLYLSYIDALKSDNCTNQASTESSDAITSFAITISSTLLVILGGLLYLF